MELNKNNSFVSVVMSVYNGEKFLRRAIDSILGQTYSDFEFIIVNDGSSDSSEAIIKSYTDKRIVLINNDGNKGLIISLNAALAIAKGQLIARMDADDIAMPSRIEAQVQYFLAHPGLVVLGSAYQVLKDNRINGTIRGGEKSDYLKGILLFSTCFAHPTVMMKNGFTTNKIMYEPDFLHAEDFRLWTKLAAQGDFYTLSEPLLQYRHHQAQVSSRFKEKQLQVSSEIRKAYLESLGFTINPAQLQVHNFIGNNSFIRSAPELSQVETWLKELISQNSELKVLDDIEFKRVIHKYWLDSCGHSNLGLGAYAFYFKSTLAALFPLQASAKFRLLAKCIIRRFR